MDSLLSTFFIIGLLAFIYVRWNDAALQRLPPRALAISPHRCTEKDVHILANRLIQEPRSVLDQLPPQTGRRYIVVGGVCINTSLVRLSAYSHQAGFVGGWIVVHLLQRGEDPRKIRVIDIRLPTRQDLTSGLAKHVHFMQVDITDAIALENAFNAPWPTTDTLGPEPELTVFHTAACIRYYERHPSLLPYSARVNIGGTQNVVNAARSAGASILVFTSSGTIPIHNSRFWLWPWETEPKFFVQVVTDDEKLIPKRHYDFYSNYAVTKAQADRIVREADRSPSAGGILRTGCIRPVGIFGPGGDVSTSVYLRRKITPSWASTMLQSWMYVENCTLAHLCYEQRLLETLQGGTNPDIGGQGFCVTDPGAPVTYGDMHMTLTTLTNGRCRFPTISPTLILFVSHIVEFYYLTRLFLLSYAPFIGSWLPAKGDVMNMQPSMFALTGIHAICDDSRARLPPHEGGLGYRGSWTTLEGLHTTVQEYKKSSKSTKEASGGGGNISAMFDVGMVTTGAKLDGTGRVVGIQMPN